MNKTIIISGGTGLIGSRLAVKLKNLNYKIIILSRNPENASIILPGMDGYYGLLKSKDSLEKIIEGSSVIINFAGASIGAKRWTKTEKINILIFNILRLIACHV